MTRWSSHGARRQGYRHSSPTCRCLWIRPFDIVATEPVAQSRDGGIRTGSAVARRRGTGAANKLERRREAREQRQRVARHRRWRKRSLIGASVLAVVGGIAALIVVWIVSSMPSAEVAARRVRVDDEGRLHVRVGEPITYENVPPASGAPLPPLPRRTGFTKSRSRKACGCTIWSTAPSRCCIDARLIATEIVPQIEAIYENLPNGAFGEVKLIAMPYAGLAPKFMLVAWHWQEPMDIFEPEPGARVLPRLHRPRTRASPVVSAIRRALRHSQ